jgi:hypothetical protein
MRDYRGSITGSMTASLCLAQCSLIAEKRAFNRSTSARFRNWPTIGGQVPTMASPFLLTAEQN